ncbi:Uncharacterised protein [Vibrio cholerae]|nr:Uncharacterised protein [Vibrio cholerae]
MRRTNVLRHNAEFIIVIEKIPFSWSDHCVSRNR